MLYDVFQRSLGKLYLGFILVETRIVQFTRYQMAFGYFDLLLSNVTSHLYHLHTVAQWGGNGANVVGRGDKHYF